MTQRNLLYYGDNLEILRNRGYCPDNFVDLIYLDPPFNSNQDFNAFLTSSEGVISEAQILAFKDTWAWTQSAEDNYHEIMTLPTISMPVSKTIEALMIILRRSPMMAYLVMMAVRLVELHRTLKPTGSLYLHCDPTASHYLKLVLDAVFGAKNFRNEIIWARTGAKSLAKVRLPKNHDVILFYQKSDLAYWNPEALFKPYDLGNLDAKTAEKYSLIDADGRLYQLSDLTNPNRNRPNLEYEFLGITRVWRWTKERMREAYEAGIVIQPSPGAVPRLKRYLDEQKGKPLSDVWTDIAPLNSQSRERTGYPTQKPEALLERIITLSSRPGDLILDPFCGCGTSVAAAQNLGRRWVGIDITHFSVALMKYRLKEYHDLEPSRDYDVVGEPISLDDARQLAVENRYQFEHWVNSLLRARPNSKDAEGSSKQRNKKATGGDSGWDGEIGFLHDSQNGTPVYQRVLIQVKSGKVSPDQVRSLIGAVESEKAAIGVFVALQAPSPQMLQTAMSMGKYESPAYGTRHDRLQIFTVEELLNGKDIDMPPRHGTFKQLDRHKPAAPDQLGLL